MNPTGLETTSRYVALFFILTFVWLFIAGLFTLICWLKISLQKKFLRDIAKGLGAQKQGIRIGLPGNNYYWIQVPHSKFRMELRYYPIESSRAGRAERLEVVIPFVTPVRIVLSRLYLGPMIMEKPIKTGDSVFDSQIYIGCKNPVVKQKLLNSQEIRDAVKLILLKGYEGKAVLGNLLTANYAPPGGKAPCTVEFTGKETRMVFMRFYPSDRFDFEDFLSRVEIWREIAYQVKAIS